MTAKTWLPLLAAATSGCILDTQTHTDAITIQEPIEGVVAVLGEGDVRVTGTSIDGAEIFQQLEWSGRHPDITVNVSEGILYIEASCRAVQMVCRIDHELIVPEGAWIDVRTGSGHLDLKGSDADIVAITGEGDVSLSSVSGAMLLDTTSGNITLADVTGNLSLYSGSGDIWGSGLALSTLDAQTGSGDIEAALDAKPDSINVVTGSGDVALQVPQGAYAVDISTGAGDVDVEGITIRDASMHWISVCLLYTSDAADD